MGSIVGIFIALMVCIVPIVIISIIVVAIVRKNKDGDISENFEKIIRTIYVYLLLIAFLFMIVGSVIFAVNSAVNYYIPESKITAIANDTTVKDIAIYPDVQSKEIAKLQKERELKSEKNQSIIDLASALAMFAIALPMFVYHSKLAKKLKEV